jgi:murein hydrolase activator
MLKAIGAGFFATIFSLTVFAQQQSGSSAELKRKQAEIQHEISDLKNTLRAATGDKKVGLRDLEIVRKKLQLREQAIDNISRQIDNIEGNIGRSQNEIDRLKTDLDTLKQQYAGNIVLAYQNRNNYDYLSFIFSAANFNDALRRIQYLRAYHLYREEQAVAIKNMQQLLQQKIGGLEVTRKEKDAVLQKQQSQKMELVSEKKEKNEIVGKLKAREKEITKELIAKQKTDIKLKRAIDKAIDREMAAAEKAAGEKAKDVTTATAKAPVTRKGTHENKKDDKKHYLDATPEGIRISANFFDNKGRLPWPVDKGYIKIHFGTYLIEEINIRGFNSGITIETEAGATVKAVFDGEVISVFDIEGNWNVIVRHGKYFTTYSDLSSVSVSKSEKVTTGQQLGKAATNKDGKGEISLMLMQGKENFDPEKWLRRKSN